MINIDDPLAELLINVPEFMMEEEDAAYKTPP